MMNARAKLWISRVFLTLLILFIAGVITGGAVGLYFYQSYQSRAAKFDLKAVEEVSERSAVYDADGNLYSYIHGENRITVPLAKISPLFISALIAREDSRFHQHDGVDYKGILRAAVRNVEARGVKE